MDGGRLYKLDQDRVYRQLALVNTGPGSNLSIDYNLSIKIIFIRVALNCQLRDISIIRDKLVERGTYEKLRRLLSCNW